MNWLYSRAFGSGTTLPFFVTFTVVAPYRPSLVDASEMQEVRGFRKGMLVTAPVGLLCTAGMARKELRKLHHSSNGDYEGEDSFWDHLSMELH